MPTIQTSPKKLQELYRQVIDLPDTERDSLLELRDNIHKDLEKVNKKLATMPSHRKRINDMISERLDEVSGKVEARILGAWVPVYIHSCWEGQVFNCHQKYANGNPFATGHRLEIEKMSVTFRKWYASVLNEYLEEHNPRKGNGKKVRNTGRVQQRRVRS